MRKTSMGIVRELIQKSSETFRLAAPAELFVTTDHRSRRQDRFVERCWLPFVIAKHPPSDGFGLHRHSLPTERRFLNSAGISFASATNLSNLLTEESGDSSLNRRTFVNRGTTHACRETNSFNLDMRLSGFRPGSKLN